MREFKKAYRAKLDSLNQSNAHSAALMDSALRSHGGRGQLRLRAQHGHVPRADVPSGFAPDDAGPRRASCPRYRTPTRCDARPWRRRCSGSENCGSNGWSNRWSSRGKRAADGEGPLRAVRSRRSSEPPACPCPPTTPERRLLEGAVAPGTAVEEDEAECASGAACEGKGCPMRNSASWTTPSFHFRCNLPSHDAAGRPTGVAGGSKMKKRHEEHDEEMPSRDTRYQRHRHRPSTATRDQQRRETRVLRVFFFFFSCANLRNSRKQRKPL